MSYETERPVLVFMMKICWLSDFLRRRAQEPANRMAFGLVVERFFVLVTRESSDFFQNECMIQDSASAHRSSIISRHDSWRECKGHVQKLSIFSDYITKRSLFCRWLLRPGCMLIPGKIFPLAFRSFVFELFPSVEVLAWSRYSHQASHEETEKYGGAQFLCATAVRVEDNGQAHRNRVGGSLTLSILPSPPQAPALPLRPE